MCEYQQVWGFRDIGDRLLLAFAGLDRPSVEGVAAATDEDNMTQVDDQGLPLVTPLRPPQDQETPRKECNAGVRGKVVCTVLPCNSPCHQADTITHTSKESPVKRSETPQSIPTSYRFISRGR
jgi:hypothetical protein